jgi:hypothetical protein
MKKIYINKLHQKQTREKLIYSFYTQKACRIKNVQLLEGNGQA